jgi:hypothetical protein
MTMQVFAIRTAEPTAASIWESRNAPAVIVAQFVSERAATAATAAQKNRKRL